MMGDGSLLLTVEDDVATLRLNRPDQGNALDLPTAHELLDAARSLHARPGLRAVVLTAGGRLFCAGGDVRAMAAAADPEAFVRDLAGTVHEALASLRTLPVPVLAAVQGTAAGGGLGLVLAADIAIASEQAHFVGAYGEVGLSPDCGVSALLPSVVGPRRAAQFALTDLVLDAATALEWGLITEHCPADDLTERVRAVVARIAARPAASRGATALLLRGGLTQNYPEHLAAEADSIARLAATPEAGALIAAFGRPQAGANP